MENTLLKTFLLPLACYVTMMVAPEKAHSAGAPQIGNDYGSGRGAPSISNPPSTNVGAPSINNPPPSTVGAPEIGGGNNGGREPVVVTPIAPTPTPNTNDNAQDNNNNYYNNTDNKGASIKHNAKTNVGVSMGGMRRGEVKDCRGEQYVGGKYYVKVNSLSNKAIRTNATNNPNTLETAEKFGGESKLLVSDDNCNWSVYEPKSAPVSKKLTGYGKAEPEVAPKKAPEKIAYEPVNIPTEIRVTPIPTAVTNGKAETPKTGAKAKVTAPKKDDKKAQVNCDNGKGAQKPTAGAKANVGGDDGVWLTVGQAKQLGLLALGLLAVGLLVFVPFKLLSRKQREQIDDMTGVRGR